VFDHPYRFRSPQTTESIGVCVSRRVSKTAGIRCLFVIMYAWNFLMWFLKIQRNNETNLTVINRMNRTLSLLCDGPWALAPIDISAKSQSIFSLVSGEHPHSQKFHRLSYRLPGHAKSPRVPKSTLMVISNGMTSILRIQHRDSEDLALWFGGMPIQCIIYYGYSVRTMVLFEFQRANSETLC